MQRLLVILLSLYNLTGFAEPGAASLDVEARVLTSTIEIAGASALPGDIQLSNGQVSFIVTSPQHAGNNMVSGGYVADAWLNDVGVDALGHLHLFLNGVYPRMARFESVHAGTTGDGSAAWVVATGKDSEDGSVDVTSTYTLLRNSASLHVETAITARQTTVSDYLMGDALTVTGARKFLPNQLITADTKFFESLWMGALTDKVAYGYWAEADGPLWGPIGGTFLDANITTVTLAPNEPAYFVRHLTVGRDLSEVVKAANSAKRITVVPTIVRLNSEGSEKTLLKVQNETGAIAWESRVAPGDITVELPTGKYVALVSDSKAGAVGTAVPFSAGQTSAVLVHVISGACIDFRITDENGKSMPGRLTVEGINGTSTPVLGESFAVPSGNVAYATQEGATVGVPAGDYRLTFSRGIGYNSDTREASLKAGQTLQLSAKLAKAYDTGNAVSADFHLHMSNSPDSGVTLEDRVLSCVGEGLDVLVSTDHNFVTDLSPVIKRIGVEEWATSIIGLEATTRKHFFGHFNVFPVVPDATKIGNGAVPFESTVAVDMFTAAHAIVGEQVIQINHARGGGIGYFNRINLGLEDGFTTHPNWSDNFTAMEIFNGKRVPQAEEMIHDWFNLLNIGYRFTGMANSDTHHVHAAEPGFPRSYVFLPGNDKLHSAAEIDHDQVIAAVKNQHAVLCTNGPFVRFSSIKGTGIGGQETITTGPVRFNVSIEGANFVQPSLLELFGNGRKLTEVRFNETSGGMKWSGALEDAPTTDTWYVAKVTGTVSMAPVMSAGIKPGEDSIPLPFAITNPIWIDRDGDGQFSAIRADLYRSMHEDRSSAARAQLDTLIRESRVWKAPISTPKPRP